MWWNSFQTDARTGLTAEVITYPGGNGDEIHAWFARPTGDAPAPGIVAVHHLPGWDEFYREFCERPARHGYSVLCPDLYCRYGHGTPDDVGAPGPAGSRPRPPATARPASSAPARAAGTRYWLPPGWPGSTRSPTCGAGEWSWLPRTCPRPARSRPSTSPPTCPPRCSACSATTTPIPRRPRSTSTRRRSSGTARTSSSSGTTGPATPSSTTRPRCTAPSRPWTAGKRSSTSSAASCQAEGRTWFLFWPAVRLAAAVAGRGPPTAFPRCYSRP